MPGTCRASHKSAGPTIRKTFYIDDMKIHAAPVRTQQRSDQSQADGSHDREKQAVVMVTSTYEPAEIRYNRFRCP